MIEFVYAALYALLSHSTLCIVEFLPLVTAQYHCIQHSRIDQIADMAPFRIPFTSKRPTTNGVEIPSDENVKPSLGSPYKPSLALSTKERRDEPNEFKLSCMLVASGVLQAMN